MAIYIRSRPTTGIRVFGYLSALATVGVAIVYPAVLFLAACSSCSYPVGP